MGIFNFVVRFVEIEYSCDPVFVCIFTTESNSIVLVTQHTHLAHSCTPQNLYFVVSSMNKALK